MKLTEEDLKFNRGTTMWFGKMLKNMTKEELIDAFWEFGQLYQSIEKNHKKDMQDLKDFLLR